MKELNDSERPIFVTGAAGFIGAALCMKLLENGENVIGFDNLNNYYDVNLKKNRLKNIFEFEKKISNKWLFHEESLENYYELDKIFKNYSPKVVVNLAAQAGVRYSLENPFAYVDSNLKGFINILEVCRNHDVLNLIFSSSSSVYGGNEKLPYQETDEVNHPVSLYAATKKSNELMAHSYSHLFKIPVTGLRFFTVYGPWGRPDMAPMIFANAILNEKPIKVFNYGNMKRDFTYIDDVVEAIFRCCYKRAFPSDDFDEMYPNPSISKAPYRIFNVGNNDSIQLMDFISLLEKNLGKKADKKLLPLQKGDVLSTFANTKLIESWINFKPNTKIDQGIKLFTKWYLNYYK